MFKNPSQLSIFFMHQPCRHLHLDCGLYPFILGATNPGLQLLGIRPPPRPRVLLIDSVPFGVCSRILLTISS
jgi:hypothetical protein